MALLFLTLFRNSEALKVRFGREVKRLLLTYTFYSVEDYLYYFFKAERTAVLLNLSSDSDCHVCAFGKMVF